MKNKIAVLFLSFLVFTMSSYAQKEKMTREDKDEKNQARTARINSKNDYAVFHRQMLSLKEYLDERKKIPALQKANKGSIVKVVVVVDSTDDADEDAKSKTLTGSIRQDIGDNSTNMYDVVFDRAQKKIISVKMTPEAAEAEKDKEDPADKPEKTTTVKSKEKTIHKKNKDDDDDDDGDEDKPVKSKSKQKDKDGDDD